MDKMTNKNEVDMPLSNWFALCENNIYNFAKQQMSQSGIPVDLQPTVMKCVLLKMQQDYIDVLVNQNAELIINNSGGNNDNDTS